MPWYRNRKIRIYNGHERSIFVRVEDGNPENKTVGVAINAGVGGTMQAGAAVYAEKESQLIREGFVKIRPTNNLPFEAKKPYVTIITIEGKEVCHRYKIPRGINIWIITDDAVIKPAQKGEVTKSFLIKNAHIFRK